jgi:hypothetical protein
MAGDSGIKTKKGRYGTSSRGASPAAAAGQEKAYEEVMLGMGMAVDGTEHGNLGSGGRTLAHR